MGILADISAISADSAQLATDTATLNALQSTIAADQAAIAGDSTAVAAANLQLSNDLQTSGPVFVLNTDGSVNVYQFSPDPPGYTITVAQPAS